MMAVAGGRFEYLPIRRSQSALPRATKVRFPDFGKEIVQYA
jgi:hypothetical protein